MQIRFTDTSHLSALFDTAAKSELPDAAKAHFAFSQKAMQYFGYFVH